MQSLLKLLILLLFTVITPLSYAGYDSKCLSDCFATGHECKFCSYQCFSEDYANRTPYNPATECPLTSYYRSLQ